MRAAAIRNCTRGASAAEFALVLPLLLLFIFGLIDAGRFLWEYNRAEKATQMGVRFAVVTDPVATGVATYGFATDGGISAGSPIPTSAFESATCTQAACTCSPGGAMCTANGHDADAFAAITDRMAQFFPRVEPANVEVEYRNVGLGYAGNPNGPDVAPMVTVRLTDMQFQPITTLLFGAAFAMPDFRAALTLEDGAGSTSN